MGEQRLTTCGSLHKRYGELAAAEHDAGTGSIALSLFEQGQQDDLAEAATLLQRITGRPRET
jgi:hypothetical protein